MRLHATRQLNSGHQLTPGHQLTSDHQLNAKTFIPGPRRLVRRGVAKGLATLATGLATLATGLALLGFVLLGSGRSSAADEPAPAWHTVQSGLMVRGLSCLRLDPKTGDTLYAHVHGIGPARSTDQGRSWEPMLEGTQLKPGLMDDVRITIDRREPRIVYVVIDGRVFRSENGGDKFTDITTGALSSHSWDKLKSDHLAWEVRVDDKKSALLLAGTKSDGLHRGGLFESQDGGKNWELIAGNAKPDSALDHDAYWIRRDPKTEKNLTVVGKRAVWFSDDRGRKFRLNLPGIKGVRTLDVRDVSEFVSGSRELYLADERGIWQSKDAGKGWGRKPVAIGDAVMVAIDPHARKRVLAVMRDKGLVQLVKKSLRPMGLPADADADTPYPDLELSEIAFHPRDKAIVYGVSPVTGLHRSTDGGAHFAPVKATEGKWPLVPTTLRVVGRHALGNKSHLAVSAVGRVYRSADGATWALAGRLGMAPHAMRPDPAMVGAWMVWGRSLLRSEDDGATWKSLWSDPTGNESVADVQRDASGILHILLSRSGRVLRWGPHGPKQADGWSVVKKGPLDAQSLATSLAIDPADPKHWVMCARSVRDNWSPTDKSGGVYETWDAGSKWSSLNDGLSVSKKASSADREERAFWNHGRLVYFVPGTRLLLYATDWRGILLRESILPSASAAEKKAAWPTWVLITPDTSPGRATVAAWDVRAQKAACQIVVQLRGSNNATASVEATGASLAAAWQHAHDAAQPPKKGEKKADESAPVVEAPKAWISRLDPGVVLSSLAIDAGNPSRLIAGGAAGAHLFQVASPTEKDADKESDAKDGEEEDGEEKDGDKPDDDKSSKNDGDDAVEKDGAVEKDASPDKDGAPKKGDAAKADPKKPESEKTESEKTESEKTDPKKPEPAPAGK